MYIAQSCKTTAVECQNLLRLLYVTFCAQKRANLQVVPIGSVSSVYVVYVQMMPAVVGVVTAKYLTSGRLFSSGIF